MAQKTNPHIRICTIGHVDHGKTTLTSAITLILSKKGLANYVTYDSINSAPEDKIRGITIRTSQIEYETTQRQYTQFDCPASSDYVKNLITGAIEVDTFILVVSALDGPMKQTEEHISLAKSTGTSHIIVFLNKVDLVDDPELIEVVQLEIRELLTQYGFSGDRIPIIQGSALDALNNPENEEKTKCISKLIQLVDEYVPNPISDKDRPFLLPIEDVFSITGRGTIPVGRIERGIIRVGEEVEIIGLGARKKCVVTGIEMYKKIVDVAFPGDNVGLLVRRVDKAEIAKGMVIATPNSITPHTIFKALIYILTKEEGGRHTPFLDGYRPQLYFRTIDVTSVFHLKAEIEEVAPGDSLVVEIELVAPIAIEKGLRFAIREGGRTVGAGLVTEILDKPRLTKAPESVNKKLEPRTKIYSSPIPQTSAQQVDEDASVLKNLLEKVSITHDSFKTYIEKKNRGSYSAFGPNVEINAYVPYPETQPDGVTYLQTWAEPVGLIRLSDEWPENIYTAIRSAADDSRASLRIKCHKYPSYPILQFVLTVKLPEFPGKPWFTETLGDISDGNFQGFILDAVKLGSWQLVVGRYGSDATQETSTLKVASISVSKEWLSRIIQETQDAANYFLSIPTRKRDFNRAARDFLKDNAPLIDERKGNFQFSKIARKLLNDNVLNGKKSLNELYLKQFCDSCENFDTINGSCSKIHENVRLYPKRAEDKCGGRFYISKVLDTAPISKQNKGLFRKRRDFGLDFQTERISSPPWEWSKPAPKEYGSDLLQLLRPSLPIIFAAVAQPGRDPVFILADVVSELRWRGLLYLLFKHEKLYYSPEAICGLSPQFESISGVTFYKAPTIRGIQLKVGIYAVERKALVTELCGIKDIPLTLIKQVQLQSPKDMMTVAYFCGLSLGVRYISLDGSKDESPPMDSLF